MYFKHLGMANINTVVSYKYIHFKFWQAGIIFSISFLAFSRSYADNIDLQLSGLIVDHKFPFIKE